MSTKILFFSRGRGRGHAIPDLAFARAMLEMDARLDIIFASYGTGAQTLHERGWPVIDLELPEANSFIATQLRCTDAIRLTKPTIVFAHEEFAALVAARIAGIPSIFISAWLPRGSGIQSESLTIADAIILLEHPGIFPVPPLAETQVHYIGPVLRKLKYAKGDRERARAEIGVRRDSTLLTVVPGAFIRETQSPIANAVFGAWNLLPSPKELVWVAGDDANSIATRSCSDAAVRVVDSWDPIEQLIVASDLLITKGTRGTSLDAAALGIPTISLSHGHNPMDDFLISRMTSNVALDATATDGQTLFRYINAVLRSPQDYQLRPGYARPTATDDVAKILISETERLTNSAEQRA